MYRCCCSCPESRTKKQEPPTLQTQCTRCNHQCDLDWQSKAICEEKSHTGPQQKIAVSRKNAWYYNMQYIIFAYYFCTHKARILHQFVIGEFRVVLVWHSCHVYFMTGQRDLMVIILNGPIRNAMLCFATNFQLVLPHISRIE